MAETQVDLPSRRSLIGMSEFEKYLRAFVDVGDLVKARELFQKELLKILRKIGNPSGSIVKYGPSIISIGERIFGPKETEAIVEECVCTYVDEVQQEP